MRFIRQKICTKTTIAKEITKPGSPLACATSGQIKHIKVTLLKFLAVFIITSRCATITSKTKKGSRRGDCLPDTFATLAQSLGACYSEDPDQRDPSLHERLLELRLTTVLKIPAMGWCWASTVACLAPATAPVHRGDCAVAAICNAEFRLLGQSAFLRVKNIQPLNRQAHFLISYTNSSPHCPIHQLFLNY